MMSIPLFAILSCMTIRFGAERRMFFAAVGNVAPAALTGVIELKTGMELALVTMLVYVGIRLAPVISGLTVR